MQRTFVRLSGPLAVITLWPALANAVPPSTSPYITDPQHSYVEDHTSEGIEQVNMITCFMGAMKPDALVNQGDYLALIDDSKCDTSGRDSSGNSGATSAGASASRYVTATLNSSRASNNDPMIVKTWVEESDEGQQMTIHVHTSASQAPTVSDPYGVFRLDFCGKPDGGGSNCMFNGFLQATGGSVNYYEQGSMDGGSETVALSLTATGTDAGSGRMLVQQSFNMFNSSADYSFAFNSDYFRRSDGTDDLCFSRDARDPQTGFSVWRYGLYDASTGERVNRNSGFPIEYTHDNVTYHGYMGYWGLWLPQEVMTNLSSGATVNKVDYDTGAPVGTPYTLVKADGKLTKYTRHSKTLSQISKLRFTYWASSNNAPPGLSNYAPGNQYQMHWDEVNKQFVISGAQNCGSNGCTMNAFTPVNVPISYWKSEYAFGLFGWSQSIGGDVFIDINALSTDGSNSSSVEVSYRTQDLVYPSQYANIGQLYCIADCPTPAGIAGGNPFGSTEGNFNPTPLANLVSYTLNASSGNLEHNGSAVSAAANSLSGRFQWGVRTGRLFPVSNAGSVDAADGSSDNSYQEWSVDQLNTYYVWETGPNAWNQFSAVKDSSDNFVTFDPPLSVNFTVPSGAAYGDYAGQTLVLEYNGFGDLWGIPGACVNSMSNEAVSCDSVNARYVPEFIIPFDATNGRVTQGNNTYLVKWLDREIRFAKKDNSVCAAAGLDLPSGVTLPSSADLKDPTDASSDVYIGTKPTVTAAPRVIHGQVQY